MAREKRRYRQYVKAMALDHVSQLDDFLTEMRRYQRDLSMERILQVFNPTDFGQMVKGIYPSVFNPQTYYPSYETMGQWIKFLLKDPASKVSNPKRLYAQLSKVIPVKRIVEGQFNQEEGKALLAVLKNWGVDLREWELLLLLTAKVELKGSPQFLMAGNASVCCMSFGESNARTYALEKGFGVLNFYDRRQNTRDFSHGMNAEILVEKMENNYFLVLIE